METLPPIDMLLAWHGRLMVLAWVVLFPAGILIARFFKITLRQRWPEELDNRFWWHSHLVLQILAGAALFIALCLILLAPEDATRSWWLHRGFGWAIITLCCAQFLSGFLRGTKGGPGNPAADGSWAGDHYDMTRRRRLFEAFHRGNGYLLLLLSMAAVVTGLSTARAPTWMLPSIMLCWGAYVMLFIILQRRGLHTSSHEAIWGPRSRSPNSSSAGNEPATIPTKQQSLQGDPS